METVGDKVAQERQVKRQILIVLVAVWAGMGFLESMLEPESSLSFACQIFQVLLTSLLALYWVVP